MVLPKYEVISYYKVVNDLVVKFIKDHESEFTKDSDSYVFSKNVTDCYLRKYFFRSFIDWIVLNTKQKSTIEPHYYFFVNNCKPKDNILLKIKNGEYFPKKLERLIAEDGDVEFYLREKDVKIDIRRFNSIISWCFEFLFENRGKFIRKIGEERSNVHLVQHRRLDYVTFKKIFRHMFGRKNVIKNQIDPENEKLVNVNILLNTYIKNKVKLNSDLEFKETVLEVENYIKEVLNGKEQEKLVLCA